MSGIGEPRGYGLDRQRRGNLGPDGRIWQRWRKELKSAVESGPAWAVLSQLLACIGYVLCARPHLEQAGFQD